MFLKAPFLVLHFSFYTLMTYLMMLFVILLSVLTITAFYFKYEQTSHLWQQLELAFELEYMLFYKQCFLSTQLSIA